MTSIYLAALAFGGTLLLVSLLFGGKDVDHHVGNGLDGHETGGLDWAPVLSLRFWTFTLAFGGGVGLALTRLGDFSRWVTLAIALAIAWAAGIAVVAVLRQLDRKSTSSAVIGGELVGATATVMIAVAPGSAGKIRLDVKGRVIDAIAETEDDQALPIGRSVMIVSTLPGGRLMVTGADA